MAYEDFRKKVVHLQSDVNLFETFFLDRDDFKKFADNLKSNVDNLYRICITGYFSETIRKPLEKLLEPSMVEKITIQNKINLPTSECQVC